MVLGIAASFFSLFIYLIYLALNLCMFHLC